MRLKYQIFLTLLAASALLIAIMFAISSWSFSRGFLDYVHQNEINRLSPLAEELVFEFEQAGNWESVDDSALSMFRPSRRGGSRGRAPDSKKQSTNAIDSSQQREGNERRNSRPPPRRERAGPPLVLTDANNQVLLGKLNSKATMQWISLESDAKVIGYLGFPQNARVDRYFDQVFESKQRKTFVWTALAMILLSALLSIPLASRIVRPLLSVNKAVDAISGGDYAHRIDNTRSDELGELANNINTLGITLEQNRDSRQRWIAEISHELRTPLAVMRGEIEAVQDGVRVLDKPAIDSLHGEVMDLGRLIDDLHMLSMSDVGALNYEMANVELSALLNDFLTSNKTMLEQHNISLSTDIDIKNTAIQADSQRIEQLLTNLLQNTCRYTDAGGRLDLLLGHSISEGRDALVIDWFDSSPGVDAQALPKLFDPLFRTEISRNKELCGSGLGLSIAKRIVEAHQGVIVASESSLGGLHIKISFPINSRSV